MSVLHALLKLGKILAVAPSCEATKTGKLYSFVMAGLITLGVGVSIVYRIPFYGEADIIQLVIQILLDSTLYVFNMYTVLTSQRSQIWHELVKNLETLQTKNTPNEGIQFVSINLMFWGCQIYMTLVAYRAIKVDFFKQMAIEYLQFYDQFIVNYTFYVLLKMILARYRFLTNELQHSLSVQEATKVKRDFCRLKESVDRVNTIFGWPFLLTIVNASLQTLLYLQTMIIFPSLPLDSVFYTLIAIFWQYVSLQTVLS